MPLLDERFTLTLIDEVRFGDLNHSAGGFDLKDQQSG